MARTRGTCEGHERHICALAEGGSIERELEDFKELVAEPHFVCRRCGRAAKLAESLCEPEII